PGIMNAFLTAFNPTPTAGGWEIGAEPAHWPYPWPAAIVAPGYTWQMVSQINTGFLDAALFWLVSSLA
ncbi:MAG: hypothetical protein ACRDOE_19410, partial [Streptosporangiaceae bacterium]